jgi:hypothetical protein
MDDLTQLLIYLLLGLIGVLASAYQSKRKKQQAAARKKVPPEIRTQEERDFRPDLGPFMEMFDIPVNKPVQPAYDSTVSEEIAVEEDYEGPDNPVSKLDMVPVEETEALAEEGQPALRQSIGFYQEMHPDLEAESIKDDIALEEITSVEISEAREKEKKEMAGFFDARKAIIYSEILKRKEF